MRDSLSSDNKVHCAPDPNRAADCITVQADGHSKR